MTNKEATARIKINKLLEAAGWRFFPTGSAPANIHVFRSGDLRAKGPTSSQPGATPQEEDVPQNVKGLKGEGR